MFTAWIIPAGFKHRNVGVLAVPVAGLYTAQLSALFKVQDRDTMTAYCDKIRTSLDKDRCQPHWVHTEDADARDEIHRRRDVDEKYDVHREFYTA